MEEENVYQPLENENMSEDEKPLATAVVNEPPMEAKTKIVEITKPVPGRFDIDEKTGRATYVKPIRSNEAQALLDRKPMSNTKAINEDGTLTDYGRSQALIQAVEAGASEGRKIIDVIDKDVPNESRLEAKVLMYRRLLETDTDPLVAADMVGLQPKAIEMTNKLTRFVEGAKLTTNELKAGALSIMDETNKFELDMQGDSESPLKDFWSADVAKANKAYNKSRARVNMATDLYKTMNTTYDVATGQKDIPWDFTGSAGEAVYSMVGGAVVGTFVKGTTALQTATRQAWTSYGLAVAESSIAAGHHKDLGRFVGELGSAVIGESLGLYASKYFTKMDYGLQENKSFDEIHSAIKGLQILEANGVKVGDLDVTNAGDMADALIGKLQNKGLTLAEANEVLKLYKDRQGGLMGAIETSVNKMGFGSVKQFQDYAEGKTLFQDLPLKIQELHRSKRIAIQESLEPKYRELETIDVDPVSGKKNLYDVKSFTDKDGKTYRLTQDLEDLIDMHKEAGQFVSNAWKSLRRHKNFETKESTLRYEKSALKRKKVAMDVSKTNNELDIVEAALNSKQKELQAIMLANSRAQNPAVNTRNAPKMVKLTAEIEKLEKDVAKGQAARGRAIAAYDKADTEFSSELRAFQDVATDDKVTFDKLVAFRKLLTNKKYVSGGAISTSNPLQEATITKGIKLVDDYMDAAMGNAKNVSPQSVEALKKFRAVTEEARDAFNIWGGSTPTSKIGQIVREGTTEDLLNFFKNNGSIEHLNALKQVAGADSKEYKAAVGHVVREKLFDGVIGNTAGKGGSNWDWEKLAKNVKDPEFVRTVVGTLGKDAYDEMVGISWLGQVMGKEFDKITREFGGILNIPSVARNHKFKNSNLGDAWNRLTFLLERYTGGLIQGKFYTGDSTQGPIKSVLKNAIANAIEVTSGQAKIRTGILPEIGVSYLPNQTMTTKQMIKGLQSKLNEIPTKDKPGVVKSFIDKMSESLKSTMKKGNRMREGHFSPFPNKKSKFGEAVNVQHIQKKLDFATDDFDVNPLATKASEDYLEYAQNYAQSSMDSGFPKRPTVPDGQLADANQKMAVELYSFKGENKVTDAAWEGDDELMETIADYSEDSYFLEGGRESYNDISKKLRSGDSSSKINKLWSYEPNFDGAVYRGTRLKGHQVKAFEAIQEGDIVASKSLMATTSSPSEAAQFLPEQTSVEIGRIDRSLGNASQPHESLVVTVRTKNGYDISQHSTQADEAEVLIKPGTTFVVLSKDTVGNIRHILLEEVSAPKGAKVNKDILSIMGVVGIGSAAKIQDNKER